MQLNDTRISAHKYAKFYRKIIKLLALPNDFVDASQVHDRSFLLIYSSLHHSP